MQHPTALLFDWDGTLADTMPVLRNAFNAVRAHFNLPLIDIAEARRISGLDKDQVFREVIIGAAIGATEAQVQEIFYAYIRQNHVQDFILLEGAPDVVALLKQRQLAAGIVTNKSREFLSAEIALLGWEEKFAATCCPNEAPKNKPAPEAAWYCLKLMNISPSRSVWFVGDTQGDVDCANQAGLTSVLLTHGQTHQVQGAALELQDLRQLANYLSNL